MDVMIEIIEKIEGLDLCIMKIVIFNAGIHGT